MKRLFSIQSSLKTNMFSVLMFLLVFCYAEFAVANTNFDKRDSSIIEKSDSIESKINTILLCEASPLELYSKNGLLYRWSGPNSFKSDLKNPRIEKVSSVDSGIYSVEVIDSNGIVVVEKTHVIVKDLPLAFVGENKTICEGDEIKLTATGGLSYFWNTNNGSESIIVSPQKTTEYTVTVNNENCNTTSTIKVYVNPKPVISFASVNENNHNSDGAIAVSISNSLGNYVYTWNNDSVMPIITNLCAGDYSVKVLDISTGCSNSAKTNIISVKASNAIINKGMNTSEVNVNKVLVSQ